MTILLRILAALWILVFIGLMVLSYFKWYDWSLWVKGSVILVLIVLASGVIEAFQYVLKGDSEDSN